MQVKVLEQLDQHTLTQPVTTVVRCKVELDGKVEAYVICYKHNNHTMWLQGSYFICKHASEQYFDYHKKEVDLAFELTEDEIKEYQTFRPRSFQEMEAYLNG